MIFLGVIDDQMLIMQVKACYDFTSATNIAVVFFVSFSSEKPQMTNDKTGKLPQLGGEVKWSAKI